MMPVWVTELLVVIVVAENGAVRVADDARVVGVLARPHLPSVIDVECFDDIDEEAVLTRQSSSNEQRIADDFNLEVIGDNEMREVSQTTGVDCEVVVEAVPTVRITAGRTSPPPSATRHAPSSTGKRQTSLGAARRRCVFGLLRGEAVSPLVALDLGT